MTSEGNEVLNRWLEDIDPLNPVLEADEAIIWRAKGTGFKHRLHLALLYAAIAVMGIVWAWPKVPAEQVRLPELQPIGGVLFLILMLVSSYVQGGYRRRRQQDYALTNRRLIIVHGGERVPPTSLGIAGRRIVRVVVDAADQTGDVSIFVEGRAVPHTLYGISEPHEIASLIISTLSLDIGIETLKS